jgi:hypothetical protein
MWHFLNARVQVGELPSSSTHSTEEESIVRRLIGCGLLLLGAVLPARGQSSSSRIPIPYRTYVAVNPLGIPFNIAAAEVESAVASGITVGGAASYTALRHDRYTTFDAKLRYYPSEVVLEGLAIGVSVSHSRYSTLIGSTAGDVRSGLDYNTVGLLADYNFLLGARKRFVVGTGVGAKRVLGNHDADAVRPKSNPLITVRFVVGLAF